MSNHIYEIISRAEAKQQGLKYYFTGKPCKHGHLSTRQIDSCMCCECDRIWHNSYNKGWREKTKKQLLTIILNGVKRT